MSPLFIKFNQNHIIKVTLSPYSENKDLDRYKNSTSSKLNCFTYKLDVTVIHFAFFGVPVCEREREYIGKHMLAAKT